MKKPMLATALLAMLLAACSDSLTAPSEPRLDANAGGIPATPVVVMSRNMYVGADVDRVIAALAGASGEDPGDALTAAINELYLTDLPTRIAALADDIARHRPTAVALQEVSTISIPMVTYGVDFLAVLQQALAARGLSYAIYSNLNFEVRPGEDGFTCCYATDLLGGSLSKRIDYVMVRGGFLDGTDRLVGGTRISLVGDTAADRVTGPFGSIWPSDHAGIVVSLPRAR